ncbi:hypothetical protein SLEP1_g16949 [Rubroshorea leprosula]|uniref:Reverse transcriptase n=1 Tax=Rubroshorea leprosula TaxID=152421 RepID=A0AAV5ISK1_9ROSI|nr:hypothetical protein SLEP1_g16949 [Rubroshorea leprosula]
MIQHLGFLEGKLPVKSLCVPLIAGKLSVLDCQPILEKIKARINGWAMKHLSFAGRVQLVNAVLFHLQVFWSSTFLLPDKVLDQIDSCCRNFIWKGAWDKAAMAMVAWEDLCLPRTEGRLGLKQIKIWDKAAVGKLLQELSTIPTNCSWYRKKIMKLREDVQPYVVMQLGDGRQSSLFYDRWLGNEPLAGVLGLDGDVNSWELNLPNVTKRQAVLGTLGAGGASYYLTREEGEPPTSKSTSLKWEPFDVTCHSKGT